MKYKVLIMPRASKELDALSPVERDRIVEKIIGLSNDLMGDVKHLIKFDPGYRLRVGDYRVLFDVKDSEVLVQHVVHRSKAYKRK